VVHRDGEKDTRLKGVHENGRPPAERDEDVHFYLAYVLQRSPLLESGLLGLVTLVRVIEGAAR